MNTIGERIKYVRKKFLNNKSQKDFGDMIGLKANSVSCIETGTNNPTEQTIKAICREFNISYLWLTEGIEPIEAAVDSDSMTRIDDIMTGENEFAKNLFKEFSKLKKEEWELLEKIIKKMAKDKGE